MPPKPLWPKVLLGLLVGAIVGWTIFAFLAWRAVTVENIGTEDALGRFREVRAALGSTAPVLEIGPHGNVITRRESSRAATAPLARLNVLTYQPGEQRFVRAEVPFWFFRLKAPAADYALRGTGVSFESLGLTAADLERYGPRLIIDHTSAAGNQLLVWTE